MVCEPPRKCGGRVSSQVVSYMAAIFEPLRASCAAALAVHFLARRQEEFLTSDTLNEDAGTAGIHRWNLILPSSAGCLFSHIRLKLVFATMSLSNSVLENTSLDDFWQTSQPSEEASLRYCGMPQSLIRVRSKTLVWL